jgi:hypothetical protein
MNGDVSLIFGRRLFEDELVVEGGSKTTVDFDVHLTEVKLTEFSVGVFEHFRFFSGEAAFLDSFAVVEINCVLHEWKFESAVVAEEMSGLLVAEFTELGLTALLVEEVGAGVDDGLLATFAGEDEGFLIALAPEAGVEIGVGVAIALDDGVGVVRWFGRGREVSDGEFNVFTCSRTSGGGNSSISVRVVIIILLGLVLGLVLVPSFVGNGRRDERLESGRRDGSNEFQVGFATGGEDDVVGESFKGGTVVDVDVGLVAETADTGFNKTFGEVDTKTVERTEKLLVRRERLLVGRTSLGDDDGTICRGVEAKEGAVGRTRIVVGVLVGGSGDLDEAE